MQQPQEQGRRFADTAPMQPVHRFPQNNAQGWQPQGNYGYQPAFQQPTPAPLSKREQRKIKRERKHRRRSPLIWNVLALIGLGTVLVQLARYVIIPLLVYLNVLTGGAA